MGGQENQNKNSWPASICLLRKVNSRKIGSVFCLTSIFLGFGFLHLGSGFSRGLTSGLWFLLGSGFLDEERKLHLGVYTFKCIRLLFMIILLHKLVVEDFCSKCEQIYHIGTCPKCCFWNRVHYELFEQPPEVF